VDEVGDGEGGRLRTRVEDEIGHNLVTVSDGACSSKVVVYSTVPTVLRPITAQRCVFLT
jgi:hypothetical protein